MKIAAVILAGGASRRMGSPKALLPYAGETFADRLIDVLASVCDPVIVVLGHDADRIRAGIRSKAEIVFNPDHEKGQLTSLQCGLRATGDAEAVLFTPVDHPAIRRDTVQMVVKAWSGQEAAVVPVFEGRHGHPVLISRKLVGELIALPSDATARDVIHMHAAATKYVETQDRGIVRDADYPADLAELPQGNA